MQRVNSEYERKRETLRLESVAVRLLPVGSYEAYLNDLVHGGRELSRIKTPQVTMDLGFAERFAGKTVEGRPRQSGSP
jgi:hypothetical protein